MVVVVADTVVDMGEFLFVVCVCCVLLRSVYPSIAQYMCIYIFE